VLDVAQSEIAYMERDEDVAIKQSTDLGGTKGRSIGRFGIECWL
jgi:hypothetical protein